MNFNTTNNTMSFQKFFGSAKRELILCQPFPYMIQICRCRYCLYSHEGKCSLKRCCCMEEKVKAHSCAFSELLRECFTNVKDNVFHYRLQIASERVSELKICFLALGHRTRFYEGCALTRCKDALFIAQLFYCQLSMCYGRKRKMCSIPTKWNTVK